MKVQQRLPPLSGVLPRERHPKLRLLCLMGCADNVCQEWHVSQIRGLWASPGGCVASLRMGKSYCSKMVFVEPSLHEIRRCLETKTRRGAIPHHFRALSALLVIVGMALVEVPSHPPKKGHLSDAAATQHEYEGKKVPDPLYDICTMEGGISFKVPLDLCFWSLKMCLDEAPSHCWSAVCP